MRVYKSFEAYSLVLHFLSSTPMSISLYRQGRTHQHQLHPIDLIHMMADLIHRVADRVVACFHK